MNLRFVNRIAMFFLALIILLSANYIIAQTTNDNKSTKGFDMGKVFTGGGIGMSFGTVTVIDFSPIIGYRFTKDLSLGVGGVFKYYNDKRYSDADKRTIYGGNAFARYNFIENIFAHVEYEHLTYRTNFFTNFGKSEQISEWGLLAGGGYRQQLSNKAYAYAMILYNFNETQYTPYENPVIRIGVEMGL